MLKGKMRKWIALALSAAIAAGTLAGCSTPGGESGGSGDAGGEKVLRYAVKNETPTMDPQMADSMYVTTLCYHMFDGLYRNNNGKAEPAAAESCDISDDQLTYTFHLRDDAKWSDGEPVVADNFVYGMQRLMDPATGSKAAFMGAILKNGSKVNNGELPVDQLGVKEIDEKTVEITLEAPAAYFLSMLSSAAFLPCRRDLVEEYGKDFATKADKNVYNGPYKMDSWEENAKMTMVKNDSYWDKDSIKLDKVEVNVVADGATQIGMFENGELDFVDIPADMVSNYPDAKSYHDGAVEYLQLNLTANPTLGNANFRRALSAAIDREEFVTLGTGGVAQAATRFVLPDVAGVDGTFGEDFPLEALSTKADDAKAKEYLATAMSELGVSDASAITLKINHSDTDTDKKKAEVLQEQIKSTLGINVELNPLPYKQLYAAQGEKNFEAMFTGWVPDYSDATSYLDLLKSDGSYNYSSYNNAEYDAHMTAALTESDPQKRCEELLEAEKIMCDELPVIPLDDSAKKYLMSDKLKDFVPYFVGTSYNYVYADFE